MQSQPSGNKSKKITVLVVDDSLVFRRFLRDIFEDCHDISIVGEARNGIEALDLVLKSDPDVILLDVEMPLMDGMTALQHLMIHRPTPTIMFSSLTDEGTARCFDTMKNGAIDFVCKDFIFQEEKLLAHRQIVIEKVRKAAYVKIFSREPFSTGFHSGAASADEEQRIVFCEDCGHKEAVSVKLSQMSKKIICSRCGDMIELEISSQNRQNSFITVIGGGEGCFPNLLEIIPKLESEMSGAVICVVHGNVQHVNAFSEYLDAISSMKVLRSCDGAIVEGGYCYLVSDRDYMNVKLHRGRPILQRLQKNTAVTGPLDVLMASVSAIYKKKTAGVILSGEEKDGGNGMNLLLKNEGVGLLLDPGSCLCKTMGENIMDECNLRTTVSIDGIVERIKKLHYGAKEKPTT
jgi:two-component system chemotaxis response regulator CheB